MYLLTLINYIYHIGSKSKRNILSISSQNKFLTKCALYLQSKFLTNMRMVPSADAVKMALLQQLYITS